MVSIFQAERSMNGKLLMAAGNPYNIWNQQTWEQHIRAGEWKRPSDGEAGLAPAPQMLYYSSTKNLPLRFRTLRGGENCSGSSFTPSKKEAHILSVSICTGALSHLNPLMAAIQPCRSHTLASSVTFAKQNKNVHRFGVVFSHLPEKRALIVIFLVSSVGLGTVIHTAFHKRSNQNIARKKIDKEMYFHIIASKWLTHP